MRGRGIFVDANLLVLLAVGLTDRRLIEKHKRLKQFSADDYDRLIEIISQVRRVFVMPNTLTEASNLLAQHREPQRSRFLRTPRNVIEQGEEVVVASAEASRNADFERLGLTDAALLETVSGETPLLTTDLDLYRAAARRNPQSAFNYWHRWNA
ncbi:PIN domain-containing protein [Candidatus Palauibacter sp.]|uniref:PIN domain-containing protein n=1 Tax=Candidatus Palauibacter sp. TaxID=3101350 RepID=UPI003B019C14